MANQFSDEQRKAIILAFNQLDKDSDGKLTREEVAQLLRQMDYAGNEQEIEQLISQIDADNNGTIEPGEFLSLMARMMLTITKEQDLLESFTIFKGQEHEVITFKSLKDILTKMGQTKMSDDDIRNMIEEADLKGDGRVTLQEFKKLMMR